MATLTGQVTVISGGLGDIGRACAVELARRGAGVAVGDVRENDQVERLRDEVVGLGRRFRFDESDVTDEKQTADWLSVVEEAFGTVTLGICNAAIVEPLDFSRLTAAAWRRHLDVNLTGAFLLANGIARRLVKRKKPGRIVFLGSWAAESVHTHISRLADSVRSCLPRTSWRDDNRRHRRTSGLISNKQQAATQRWATNWRL